MYFLLYHKVDTSFCPLCHLAKQVESTGQAHQTWSSIFPKSWSSHLPRSWSSIFPKSWGSIFSRSLSFIFPKAGVHWFKLCLNTTSTLVEEQGTTCATNNLKRWNSFNNHRQNCILFCVDHYHTVTSQCVVGHWHTFQKQLYPVYWPYLRKQMPSIRRPFKYFNK